MRLKISLLICIIFLPSFNITAQNSGTISGIVINETTNNPVEFVNVVLFNQTDSALVSGMYSDKNGKFNFSNIKNGDYYIKYSIIGFKEKISDSIKINSKNKKISLGTVSLSETTVTLDEVLITSNKSTLNSSIDRKVYNVDKDIMSKSGTVNDLLQNIPSVQVDIDGTVSLRGSSDVMIMINGKTSPLLNRNSADILDQMPASSIEKIEVITNPSAKYRPDGTSGIINIVLKKDVNLGLNGSATVSAGNNSRYNGNFSFNYNTGTLNIFGNYSIRKDARERTNTDTRRQIDSTSTVTYFNGSMYSFARPLTNIAVLGFDYNYDLFNNLGLSGNLFYNSINRNETAANLYQDLNFITTDNYNRLRIQNEHEEHLGLKFFYQHNFNDDDHKLRFEFNTSKVIDVENNYYTNVFFYPVSQNQLDNKLLTPNEYKQQVSLDYTNQLSPNSLLEAGYEGDFDKYDAGINSEIFDTLQQVFYNDTLRTSRFIVNQNINAVYTTFEQSFGDFALMGGLRGEYSYIKSNLVTLDSVITNNYFNFYPTLHLTYKFNDGAELQLNYSRRVHRPDTDDLNPFSEYRDLRNYRTGNPKLLPEYIHSVELGCKLQNSYFTFIPSLYYRYTSNTFTTVTQAINDSIQVTTRENLSFDQAGGLELILSSEVKNVFTTNLSTTIFYNTIDASNLGYSNNKSIISWSGNFIFNFDILKGTVLQFNSNYASARLTPQGKYLSRFVANMGLRQELLENKLFLTLTVADLFNTLKRQLELDAPLINETTIDKRDARIIYLGISYNFGTKTNKQKDDSIKYDNGL